ncbi:MAG: cache domain-containing protein [Deferribacterales bacterium]
MKNKLSVFTFLSMIIVAAVFSIMLIYNISSLSEKHIVNTSQELEKIFVKRQKEYIHQEINRITSRISLEKREVYQNARDTVRARVESAEGFLKNVLKRDSSERLRKIALEEMIHSFKWEYSSGYYFAMDSKGNILHHGGNPDLENQNLLNMNISGDLRTFLNKVYREKEAFGEYKYISENMNDRDSYKVAYARYDEKLGLLIGASIYLKELTDKAKESILLEMQNDRYGYKDTGYFWVITPEYQTVFHPSPDFPKGSLKGLTDIDGKLFIDEMVDASLKSGGGFVTYKWPEPGSKISVQKVAYVEYVPDWDWIICTGFYFNNLKETTELEKEVIESTLADDLRSNLMLISALFISTLLVAVYVSRKMGAVESSQTKYLNDLKQYKNVMDESSIVSITDPMGHITYVNDKFCEICGYSREYLIGKRHNIMRHPDTPNELFKDLWTTILKGRSWHGIIKNLRVDGGHFYHKVSIIPYKDENGTIVSFTSCSQDVTEVIENREMLQNVFSVDRLTGLGNRYKLITDIENSKMPSLAFIDIDRFHEINELYGMTFGDNLLSMAAERMKNQCQLKMFNIYRVHSDVFAVLAPYIDKQMFIEQTMAGINSVVGEVFKLDGKEVIIRYRAGFANDTDDIIAKADIALQQAKSENKSHVVYDIHNINNSDIYEQNIKIMKMLTEAVENDRVVPFFQPIYDFSSKSIVKYECLIRIINKDGSIMPPSEFLDVSKQTRIYPDLTKIVAAKSIDEFRNSPYEFSINFSVEDLLNHSTIDYVYDYASQAGVLNRMVIELVETEQLNSSTDVVATLEKFKQAGTKIAIDDFGTGYSNFDYLLKVHADYIKIDGSIIKLITKDERALDIVNSIVRYAKKMNMKTIGEFISDREIAKKAMSAHIDFAQGYFYGKPERKPNPNPDNTL